MITHCPVCGALLRDDAPIAIVCPNPDCPVEDDCDLWYQNTTGQWKVQHWIKTMIGPGQWRLRLSKKEK